MFGKLIGLVIAAVFIAALAPTAISSLIMNSTRLTHWGTSGLLWPIVPIIVVIAFVVLILKETGVEF